MIDTILTYIVLASQLYVLSYYYPKLFADRMSYVINNHPASEYPKLYPFENGEEKAREGVVKFKFITKLILILGIFLLVGAIVIQFTFEDSASTVLVVGFALIQTAPFIWVGFSEQKQYSMMRTKIRTSKRSADLKPRRYFDYVSPIKFSIAVLLLISYLTFNFYRNDFSLVGDGMITFGALLIMNIFFACVVYWSMRGQKINPHMSAEDRDRHITGTVKNTLYVSMLASLFLLVFGLIQHYDLDRYEAISLSIYFQLCAHLGIGTMFRANKLEDLNFDVYKKDANPA